MTRKPDCAGRDRKRTAGRGRRSPASLAALAVIASLYLAPAGAQQPASGDVPPEAEQRYQVEIIVFRYDDPASAGNEVFAPERTPADAPFDAPGEPRVFGDRMPPPAAPVPTTTENAGSNNTLEELPARSGIEFGRLEPEAFTLNGAYRKLSELDVYDPIMHAAWTQTTREKARSPALPLRTLGDPPLGLDGTIRLYQSRFLHLDVDLSLDASHEDPQSTATDRLVRATRPAADMPPGERDALAGEPDTVPALPVRYRITEDRIMHDGDIRYFDHPRFGLLVKVSRVEPHTETGPAPGD